ncbi:MAG: hypothetical protein JWP30_2102 [Homoserinimonas sp.]|jgi:hypothetical protein|nr:hypothetical protein [Homoserinimonas sp.]
MSTELSANIDSAAPNKGEGVSDATEPQEEYELDQLIDERSTSRKGENT